MGTKAPHIDINWTLIFGGNDFFAIWLLLEIIERRYCEWSWHDLHASLTDMGHIYLITCQLKLLRRMVLHSQEFIGQWAKYIDRIYIRGKYNDKDASHRKYGFE